MNTKNQSRKGTIMKSQMSRSDFFKTIGFALLAESIIISGCNNDNGNRLKTGEIKIKVKPDERNRVVLYVAAKEITIYWGDGKVEEFSPNGTGENYLHVFPDQNLQTVTLVTDSMTSVSSILRIPPGFGNMGAFHELQLGKCVELKDIHFSNQHLTILDIENAVASLELLYCSKNHLTSLDVGSASKLTILDCTENQLTKLNLSKYKALRDLYCALNQLAELDLSRCAALRNLICRGNHLTDLNLSNCKALTSLSCGSNHLAELNLSRNAALTHLSCHYNQLSILNLSNCKALSYLDCRNNRLSTSALNAIFDSLPDRTGAESGVVFFTGNPGAASCDRSILSGKEWAIAHS